MKIRAKYSHLNGIEYMIVHKPNLWKEINDAILNVDAERCRVKTSEEERTKGKIFYSPVSLNAAFRTEFFERRWSSHKQMQWVNRDEQITRESISQNPLNQKKTIVDAGLEPIRTYNEIDFVKNRIAVEVQFGKYSFVAHDLFVKHMAFYVSGLIDVGVEILPMKEMEREMSSGVPYYERDLFNVIRQGRSTPAVPLVLIGVAP